ncbi:hypothetical protein [Halorientalis sp.]|jgi:cell division control protein 6|uniref:hypothetical protein n=1 Tax=Halorientalis sp. TaxID=1931229 RepID=UPI00262CA052|nr:hypothetical protein [Halorientalis sp.]
MSDSVDTVAVHHQYDLYTSQVLYTYKKLWDQHRTDPVTHERIRQLLEELSFLEITESRNQHRGNKGQFNEHTLNRPPDIIKQIHEETAS